MLSILRMVTIYKGRASISFTKIFQSLIDIHQVIKDNEYPTKYDRWELSTSVPLKDIVSGILKKSTKGHPQKYSFIRKRAHLSVSG